MPSYKITYYAFRARAEPVRMLLALAGQKFQDVRVTQDEWLELKPKTPTGKIPVLEVDGKELPQSRAMANYIAREHGLYGSNNWEAAQMDAAIDTVSDIYAKILPWEALLNEHLTNPRAPAANEKCEVEVVLAKLKVVNDLLSAYGKGYFVGSKISIADVYFYCIMEDLKKEEVAKFPNLSALVDRIASHENIASYLKSRPVTPF